jgi:hypothetical protein
MSRRAAVWVAVPILMLVLGLVWLRRPAPRPGSAEADPSVAALRDEVTRLRRDLSVVKAQTAQSVVRQANAPTTAPAATAEPPRRMTEEERKEATRAGLRLWYTAIDTQLSSEGVDAAWSAEAARGFDKMIAAHADLATPVETHCGRTMCKLVVSHPDRDRQSEFASKMADEPQLDTEVAYRYDPDATPPRTTMWVARSGHKIPRPAQK